LASCRTISTFERRSVRYRSDADVSRCVSGERGRKYRPVS
jgi:hypothetical protein